MRSRRLWTMALLCTILASLAGQVAVSADLLEPSSPPGYALGAHPPDQEAGTLTFSEVTSVAAPSAAPAGACDWAATLEEELACLINEERRAVGLPPYKINPILATVAEGHSAYMRDNDCFDHQCPGELAPAQRACAAGYAPYCWGACFVGETIGAGFENASALVAAWMDSPSHRDILLHGELREIGVGYVAGGYYGSYWTATYGSQPDVLPVFINYDEPETDNRQTTLTMTDEKVSGCSGIDEADEVMISNDPDFAGAGWEPYVLHKPWVLTAGNGPKTVYVKYRDPTGYQVTSSDDILLSEANQYDLYLSANSLVYLYEIGSGFNAPTSRQVSVENAAGGSVMDWYAAPDGEEPWPGITPESGNTPDSVDISVDGFTTGQVGTYQESITVTSPQDPEGSEGVTVTIMAVEKVYRVMLPSVTKAGD